VDRLPVSLQIKKAAAADRQTDPVAVGLQGARQAFGEEEDGEALEGAAEDFVVLGGL
jgi:hypothetical protein